jgi:hypothetical protein
MRRLLHFILPALFSILAFLSIPAPAFASGVHIVVVKPQTQNSWLIDEYIDDSLIPGLSEEIDLQTRSLKIGMKPIASDSSESITILRAHSEHLFVFVSENLEGLESRIALSEQEFERKQLDDELRQQILRAFYQIPVWPYLAASEVPGKAIDMKRVDVLPYNIEDSFPATIFTGTGEYKEWEVIDTGKDGTRLRQMDASGEGSGIVLEYILTGSLDLFEFDIPRQASISALYILDNGEWSISGAQSRSIQASELIGMAGSKEALSDDSGLIKMSSVFIHDRQGWTSRFLTAPQIYNSGVPIAWAPNGQTVTEGRTSSGQSLGTLEKLPPSKFALAMITCWIIFGLAIAFANWLYKFSSIPASVMIGYSVAVYPLFLLTSLLTGGLWGMGFIPAAALGSRIIASEGRRIAGFGSILGACFLVMLISSLFSR